MTTRRHIVFFLAALATVLVAFFLVRELVFAAPVMEPDAADVMNSEGARPTGTRLAYSEGYYYAQGYYQGYYQSYYQSYYQGGYNLNISGNFGVAGNVTVTSNIGKGSGTFVIDHPLDPKNKLLYHSFVESPDTKNIYDGIAKLDGSGEARVVLPHYFMALNTDFRYQLKPIGVPQPNLHVQSEIRDNAFTIGGGEPEARVSWQVTGNRHDPYILAHPIITEVQKGTTTAVKHGEFMHPGIYPLFPTQQLKGSFLSALETAKKLFK